MRNSCAYETEYKEIRFFHNDMDCTAFVTIRSHTDNHYGEDADGHRGMPRTFTDEVTIDVAIDADDKEIELTDEVKDKIWRKL